MKKTRELLALALAMMMALSCMVMPAMAAHEDEHDCAVCSAEGVEPRVLAMPCGNCTGTAYQRQSYAGGKIKKWMECPDCGWRSDR